jgi:serine/threonine-protein kinase PknK
MGCRFGKDPGPAACSASISGLFYVGGGANKTNVIATNESFKLPGGIWTTLTPMPTAAVIQASATLNNVLYCIGGSNNGNLFLGTVSNNVQIYQP